MVLDKEKRVGFRLKGDDGVSLFRIGTSTKIGNANFLLGLELEGRLFLFGDAVRGMGSAQGGIIRGAIAEAGALVAHL